MTIGSAARPTRGDRKANLVEAIGIIDQSGIVESIQNCEAAIARNPKGAGAKPRLTPYPLRTILITWQEMAISGLVMSNVNILRRLNFDYTAEEIAMLDTTFFQDHERIAKMRTVSHFDPTGHPVLKAAEQTGYRVWQSEYQRFWAMFDRYLAPLDDNEFSTAKSWPGHAIDQAVRKGRKRKQTEFREHVANRIVAASVEYTNGRLFPNLDPTDLHAGVLRDHRKDIAVDMTPIDVNISRHNGRQPKNERIFSRNQMARFTPKNRRMKWPCVVGLTLAIVVGRAGGARPPSVALSMGLSKPQGADLHATTVCLDAIDRAGHRPPLTGKERSLLIGDIAYQDLKGLANYLIPNQWSPVFRYAQDENVIKELFATDPKTGAERPVGNLFKGCAMCPLADPESLQIRRHLEAPQPEIVDGEPIYDRGELEAHERELAWLNARRAGPHGRPERRPKRRPGRPSKTNGAHGIEMETIIRMRCPALAGKIRCPLRKDADSWNNLNLDIGFNPPVKPTPLCKAGTVTVRLDELQTKHLQPFMEGSWNHEDNYVSSRAYDEAYHSQLIAANVGGLRRGQITTYKNAPFTIAVAMIIASANLHALERWRRGLDLEGVAPDIASTKRRRIRERLLSNRGAA